MKIRMFAMFNTYRFRCTVYPVNVSVKFVRIQGGPKKVSLLIFAITFSTASQFNFWHVYTIGNLQPEDVAHLTRFV